MGNLAFHLGVFVALTAIIVIGETGAADPLSDIKKRLLRDYNREVPPMLDHSTQVKIGMYVNSIYDINEVTMDYTMNMYLRQTWRDPRLTFDPADGVRSIKLGEGKWDDIWIPDTFMRNEKKASFHSMTIPNRLLKLNATGHLWYVIKVTATLSCPMDFRTFPFDTQVCPIMFESYGYTMDTLHFDWLNAPVDVDRKHVLPKFRISDIILYDCSQNYTAGAFPCLETRFVLRRDIGSYITKAYLPSVGLIILSWLTLWFPTDSMLPRILLLLMPVLCMTFMWGSMQVLLPEVSYTTALDVWMIGCGCFVFAVIVELALVNILAKPNAGGHDKVNKSDRVNFRTNPDTESRGENDADDLALVHIMAKQDSEDHAGADAQTGSGGLLRKIRTRLSTGSKVSKMDKVCRIIFALAFLIFVFIYFITYAGPYPVPGVKESPPPEAET